jgi:hypothetical protein
MIDAQSEQAGRGSRQQLAGPHPPPVTGWGETSQPRKPSGSSPDYSDTSVPSVASVSFPFSQKIAVILGNYNHSPTPRGLPFPDASSHEPIASIPFIFNHFAHLPAAQTHQNLPPKTCESGALFILDSGLGTLDPLPRQTEAAAGYEALISSHLRFTLYRVIRKSYIVNFGNPIQGNASVFRHPPGLKPKFCRLSTSHATQTLVPELFAQSEIKNLKSKIIEFHP